MSRFESLNKQNRRRLLHGAVFMVIFLLVRICSAAMFSKSEMRNPFPFRKRKFRMLGPQRTEQPVNPFRFMISERYNQRCYPRISDTLLSLFNSGNFVSSSGNILSEKELESRSDKGLNEEKLAEECKGEIKANEL